MENGVIPGNPTFITPNPKIDFDGLKVKATRTSIPWPTDVPFKRASVNSFGYGGSNAHVVVDEAKKWVPSSHVLSHQNVVDADDFFEDAAPVNTRPITLVVSANDESSLKSYVKTLKTHLINPAVKVRLEDLAYTLSERKTRHFNRGYIVAKDTNFDESAFTYGKQSSEAPKIGFVFTGQGAQWSQMGKKLVETFPQAKKVILYLDEVLQASKRPPVWSLLSECSQPVGE